MKKILSIALFLLVTCLYSQTARYTVDYSRHTERVAMVTAEFTDFPTQSLSMFVHPAQGVPEGEAGFIENLVVLNEEQTTLPYKYEGMGEWKVSGKKTQSFSISYTVQLRHDQHAWFEAGGVDEVAYATNDGFFSTGYAMFLFPAIEDLQPIQDVQVNFALPEGWKASTPWNPLGNNTFQVVPDIRFLLNNCFFVGTHEEQTISLDGFELRIAYGKQYYPQHELFTDLMHLVLSETRSIFGGNMASQYLIVINPHHMTDGSAFRGSFSQIIKGEVTEQSRVIWGHTMAHETIHLWNGLTIQPNGQEEWFKEGFTDYLTMLVESRLGINDQATVLKRLEKMYTRYVVGKVVQQTDVSLQHSGDRKQELRSLVYGGGALFALALDVELREATNSAKGVDQLMKTMFDEFGRTGKRYTHADVLRIANSLAGKDLTTFFNTYLHGKGFCDYTTYFERIGLNAYPFVEEIYLSIAPNNTERQFQIRKSIFGF